MRGLFLGMEWFPECKDGGLDRYFYEQLQALAGLGSNGGIAVTTSCETTSLGNFAVRPMATKCASLAHRWIGARARARESFRDGVDLVNAHFALYAFPILGLIPKHVPLVVNFQGPWGEEMRVQSKTWKRRLFSGIAKQIELRVYRRADRVITLSEAFKELIHRDYGVPLNRVRVIPGALKLDRYLAAPERSEARQNLGWPAERYILLAVRRLAKRMGLDLLVEAVAQIRKEFPSVLLLIGGKGPESAVLQGQIEHLGLQENVRLLGFIPEDDLPLAYAAADVSVVPTVALEGFGLITAESLASGTPVLGTPVGATPEILRPLNPDLVFLAATADSMAVKLREVLSGRLTLPTREECRAYVQRYGWPQVIPKILEVYREAMEVRKQKLKAKN